MKDTSGLSTTAWRDRLRNVLRQRPFWSIQFQNLVALLTWVAKCLTILFIFQYFLFSIYAEGIDSHMFQFLMSLGRTGLTTAILGYALYFNYCLFKKRRNVATVFSQLIGLFLFYDCFVLSTGLQYKMYQELPSQLDISIAFFGAFLVSLALVILGNAFRSYHKKQLMKRLNLDVFLSQEVTKLTPNTAVLDEEWAPFIVLEGVEKRVFSDEQSKPYQVNQQIIYTRLRYSWLRQYETIPFATRLD